MFSLAAVITHELFISCSGVFTHFHQHVNSCSVWSTFSPSRVAVGWSRLLVHYIYSALLSTEPTSLTQSHWFPRCRLMKLTLSDSPISRSLLPSITEWRGQIRFNLAQRCMSHNNCASSRTIISSEITSIRRSDNPLRTCADCTCKNQPMPQYRP